MFTPHPGWNKTQSALSQCSGRKSMGAGFTHKKKNIFFFLVVLMTISSFLRFYDLNWGAPFYFHPDERNIASSVSQLKFPAQMNPHFFAYGSLPIYTIYFTGVLINFLSHMSLPLLLGEGQGEVRWAISTVSFSQAILVSRFFSALFSLTLIPLLFFIGKKLKDERTGIIAASLSIVSTGFIQFAHFGTFEMWLTLLSLLLFLSTLNLLHKPGLLPFFLTSVVFGLSVATKLSHLALLPIPIIFIIIKQIHKKKSESKTQNVSISIPELVERIDIRYSTIVKGILFFLVISILVFFITNPFVLFDYSSFYNSMKYESEVALGTLPVFYTEEFKNSLPVIFQFLHIYPFLINPLLTALFIPSFFYILFIAVKHKTTPFLLLTFCFLLLFLPQAFLYAKWTRYMMPTLPFIYLIISLALSCIWNAKVQLSKLFFSLLWSVSALFGISYFVTAFVMPDTREAAAAWAKSAVPSNAPILSEVYDLGITPFNDSFHNITLYNFYDLDNNSPQYIPRTDYIILPSQRIFKVRLQDPKTYPFGHAFYSALLAQANGFQKIYETPCDIFCKITYMGSPIYSFEETANVFDRPTVFIFKKNENL